VDPRDQEQADLTQPGQRVGDPEEEERARVGGRRAEQLVGDARPRHVGEEHGRDREAEEELEGLPGGHAEGAAAIERPEPEAQVRDEGTVEGDRAREAAPQHEGPAEPGFHRLVRDEAEGVIGQMKEDIGKEGETGREAQLPDQRRPGEAQRHRAGVR
jgi:hypothetical protein